MYITIKVPEVIGCDFVQYRKWIIYFGSSYIEFESIILNVHYWENLDIKS